MDRKKFIELIFFILIFSIAGCSTAWDKVVVTTSPAPNSCKFIEKITGENTSSVSSQDIRFRRLNGLKYEALEKGANLVVLAPQMAQTLHYSHYHRALIGNAYACPAGTYLGEHIDPFSLTNS